MPTSPAPPQPGLGLVLGANGEFDINPADSTVDVTSGLKVGTITDSNVAAANVDGSAGTPGMRTLGSSPGSAAPGDSPVPVHAYFSKMAAQLEPLAIEAAQAGTFSYPVASNVTKYILASFATRLSSSGLWEVRNPFRPVALRGATLAGFDALSTAVILDPALPVYTDPWTTYYDRLNEIETTVARYIPITAASQQKMFLPGPYGSIITNVASNWLTWLIIRVYGTTLGWNLNNENGNVGSTDYQNVSNGLFLPVSKNVACVLESGQSGGDTPIVGGMSYIHCPSTWGKVADPNTYDFRDDFMGASLNTGSVWTRTSGGGGQVEIDTAHQWLKILGDGTWGNNGAYSQASISRAAGKVFLCDFYIDTHTASPSSPVFMLGFSSGASQSYTSFAHGVIVSANPMTLGVFEDGNSRGNVGSGVSVRTIYRLRITLGTNSATYEIQGGTQYAPLGGTVWTDITPGTTSSTTTPLHAAVTANATTDPAWIGDVKIY